MGYGMYFALTNSGRNRSATGTSGGSTVSDTDQERDQAAIEQIKGKVKDAWGSLTGDKSTEAEGKVDQVKGKARESVADAKDAIDEQRNRP
jgi:uncharacterized protein YjbJ (UPF0337 family)